MKSRGILALGLALAVFLVGLVAVTTAKPIGGDLRPKQHTVLLKDGKLMAQVSDIQCPSKSEALIKASQKTDGTLRLKLTLEGRQAKAFLTQTGAPADVINESDKIELYDATAGGKPALAVIAYDGAGCGVATAVFPIKSEAT